MSLAIADWVIIISFLLVSLSIGLYYRSQAGSSLSNFFLGGRNLPWWLAGTSMVATTFAADTPLAVTELVATGGIAGNWLWWNALAGGMFTVLFFSKLWRRANILTDVELTEIRYSGKAAAFLRGFKAVYMGLFLNAVIIGWVNVALMSLLRVFFNIPIEQTLYYTAAAMLLVVVYTSLSGLKGVAVTDMVQFAMAITGCIILAVLVLNSDEVGGVEALKHKLPSGTLSFFPAIGEGNVTNTLALSLGSFLAFVTVQWWSSWYPGAEPGGGGYVAQRMMSAKTEKDAVLATLFFQVAHYCLRPWPWIIVGLCALVLYPDLSEPKLGFVMAMKDYLPDGLRGLLLVAFLAAYMSTVSTQLNWGASYLINDLYARFIVTDATQKQLVTASRVATFLMMGVALFATSLIDSVSAAWAFIVESGAGLGLVLILRWYWWRVNVWSEITATIAPFMAYGFARFYLVNYDAAWGLPITQDARTFFFTVSFTTVSWLLVTFLTSPEPVPVLKSFYERIQPGGWWQPIQKISNPALSYPAMKLGWLALAWVSAVAMAYSVLFAIGKLVLGYFQEGGLFVLLSAVCIAFFLWAAQKSKVFVKGNQEAV